MSFLLLASGVGRTAFSRSCISLVELQILLLLFLRPSLLSIVNRKYNVVARTG